MTMGFSPFSPRNPDKNNFAFLPQIPSALLLKWPGIVLSESNLISLYFLDSKMKILVLC